MVSTVEGQGGPVGFAGDWHANLYWAARMLVDFSSRGVRVVYHVGDFGLASHSLGKRYLLSLHKTAEELNMRIFIVLGNHDDYNRFNSMRTDDSGWRFLKDYPRFRFAPRGHVWLHDGVRMGALGGAGSINKNILQENVSWWPGEEILPSDVETLVANAGGQSLDILLSHEAPAGLRRTGMSKPSYLTEEVEYYCYQQRVRLRDAADATTPLWLVHGHWHEWHRDHFTGVSGSGVEYTTNVVSLNRDGATYNCMVASLVPGVGLTKPSVFPGNEEGSAYAFRHPK